MGLGLFAEKNQGRAFPMKNPTLDVLSTAGYRRRATILLAISLAVAGASVFMGFDPTMLFTEFHYVIDLFGSMSPPNLNVIWHDETIGMAVLETLSMAFLGTLIGGGFALVLAFLAAE